MNELSFLMTDHSLGDKGCEAVFEFVLSHNLRAAADDYPYRSQQPRFHTRCRQMLSQLLFGNRHAIGEGDRVVSVKVWKEWKNIDLCAEVELQREGSPVEKHLLVAELKIYSLLHSDQLRRYLETIKSEYVDEQEFKWHFAFITAAEDMSVLESQRQECHSESLAPHHYEFIHVDDLVTCGEPDTESEIFNQFWLRPWGRLR